mgnify:CR=1 FL=1
MVFSESPDSPLVIHGVQHVFHPPARLDAWPDERIGEELQTRLGGPQVRPPGHARRVASAWPVRPPPFAFTRTSNCPAVFVSSSG